MYYVKCNDISLQPHNFSVTHKRTPRHFPRGGARIILRLGPPAAASPVHYDQRPPKFGAARPDPNPSEAPNRIQPRSVHIF